jgi:hypothetical protein
MAVVINEFEVVPAEPRTAGAGQVAIEPRETGPARDPERELERHLRRRSERSIRLRAV